jgi:HTH-type transcriptional repressor of NAD biosynthesis genes
MTRGIVVGKFMPLHRGHQLLIETAQSYVDDLTVVVYDSKPDGVYPDMPPHMRARWVSKLYPNIENVIVRRDPLRDAKRGDIFGTRPLAHDDELADRVNADDPKYAPLYAHDLDFLGQFDFVFSSENYGEPFAKALGAESVVVDLARDMLPISGTQIRENVYEHRGWIDPVVYRDLVRKVVFVGTESAGKSTIAKTLAERLDTRWVHEYGRELWEAQNLKGSFHDMLKIAENHYRREEAAILHSRDFLFCDTNPWTTLQWSEMYSGSADERLYELVRRTKDEYIWFLCSNDFGWVQDGTRELVGQKSMDFQLRNMDQLVRWDIDYAVIAGSVEERVEQVIEELERQVAWWKPQSKV